MDENRTRKPPELKNKTENESRNEKNLPLTAEEKNIGPPKRNRKVRSVKKKAETGSRRCLMNEWVTPESLKVITTWKRNGLTDEEIEKNIGVAHSTFCAWKKKSKDLSNALKSGRAYADALVENALFRSAIGGIVEVTNQVIDKKTGMPVVDEKGKPVLYTERKFIEPEPKAMIFYLTNRLPKEYQMNRNLKFDLGDDKKTGGTVEIVVRNDSLQELEAKAIEEAKKKDMEAAETKNGS